MNWSTDTLNGKVYEYTASLLAENGNLITDLSMIDKFIVSVNTRENYFRNVNDRADGQATLPYLSGDIFINNTQDNPISEYELKNTYKDIYYPDLNIFCNYVIPAYTAKFIQVQDNGQETEWDVHKYDPATTTHPSISTKEDPEKLHYDFLGWAREPNGTVLTEADFAKLTYSASKTSYTFYAVFEIHKYEVQFINPANPADSKTIYISSGEYLHEPEGYLPYKDSSNLADDKVYKFVGYSNEADLSNIVDITEYLAVKNYVFYAVHEETSVYDNIIDAKYFTFEEYNYTESSFGDSSYNERGYVISPAEGALLKGKITIPAMYGELKVLGMRNFYNQEVTHIFFEKGSQLREIFDYTFCEGDTLASTKCLTLQYFEFIDSIRIIGRSAFRQIPLKMTNVVLPKELYAIEKRAFLSAFSSSTPITISIGPKVTMMSYLAFGNNDSIPAGSSIMIGNQEEKSNLDLNNNSAYEAVGYQRIYAPNFSRIEFYTSKYSSIYDRITYNGSQWSILECLDGDALDKEGGIISTALSLQIIN